MKTALVMKNEMQPEWGMGLVTNDLPQHWDLYFEHAGPRRFVKTLAKSLVKVTLAPADLAALQAKALGRSEGGARKKAKSSSPSAARAKGRFASIAEQVELFEKLFPGGFAGDAFLTEERGRLNAPGKTGYKEAAIALAQRELAPKAFESTSAGVLFESARKVLQATNIVFPIEGAIPFTAMDAESRALALEGLRQLLHGEGEYADRLEVFAASVNLKSKDGSAKAVTWPLATVFGALYKPKEYTCIKPTPFATQAATVGLTVEKSQPVTAAGYKQFLEVATKTEAALKEAGQQPRDLMDVYSFIWRTHREKTT